LTHQDLQSLAQLLPLLHLAAEELDDYQKHQPQTGAKTFHINITSLTITSSKSLTQEGQHPLTGQFQPRFQGEGVVPLPIY